jgi:hypothetical protein
VTVVPYASIPADRPAVFTGDVPTGVGRMTAQGIVLSLADVTHPTAAAQRSNYILTTAPNIHGKVKNIGVRKVIYNASSQVVTVFPSSRLVVGNPLRSYQLLIRGQSSGPVTITFNRPSIISESV